MFKKIYGLIDVNETSVHKHTHAHTYARPRTSAPVLNGDVES